MKNLLDLIRSAQAFAFETLDSKDGADLHTATADRFRKDGGNQEDWGLWTENVHFWRGKYRQHRDAKLPSQSKATPAPAK